MKIVCTSAFAGWLLCLACHQAHAQEFKEHIKKEFTLKQAAANSVLSIYNISGSVKVEGYAGDKVIIDVDQTITAETNALLEAGKKEFRLEFDQTADTVEAYIAEPYDSRPHRNWHDHRDDRRIEYDYNLEFVVKVPFSINLAVSTVNNGDVDIKDVTGMLNISNVNGSIEVTNAKGTTDAHTVNGNITLNYLAAPSQDSKFNTINGSLTVTYPANLSADFEFKSLNGSFYTDFEHVEVMPAKVVKTENRRANSTVYKLDKNNSFRIGSGGIVFKFETINGNVYIKKQS